jgi:uroporphyrinogen decarboxylase
MAGMTLRERVCRAVNFQEVDRVPIDLGAMRASGIGVKAYNRVKAKLGIRSQTRIWDPKFMIASVEEAVMRRFHLDVAPLDVFSAVVNMKSDGRWQPKTLYEGAEGLLPP